MIEQINILSAEQYFKKYAVDGIGKGADRWMIKRQLIDAFRKEIFSLVALRAKKEFKDIPPEGDPEAMRIAKNVIHDTTMKWKKLCGMFAQYKETANLIDIKDLKLYDEIEEIGTTTEDLQEKENTNDQDAVGDGNGAEDTDDQAPAAQTEEPELDSADDSGASEGTHEADEGAGGDQSAIEEAGAETGSEEMTPSRE